MHFTRLRRAFWKAFQHDQFSTAKGAAYSSILTLFPAFLVVTSILEASHDTEGFLVQIAEAVGWVLPPGSRSVALSFFQTQQHHATRIIYSASIVTLLAATGVMISWMDGFRKAYGMANTWGFWRERAVALYLVLLALIPLGFATILVVFGNEVENWVQSETMHLFKPFIVLVWQGVRWTIAVLTAIALMALMYHHGLPKTQSWRRVLPGAVFAAILWFPATVLFGWYVRVYATYTVVYGSLSAAIALLVWLYIVSVIVLFGAEMNAQVYPKQTENDVTEKEGVSQ
ncbi:MAG TPA: YihY/virulence factor BrkB family protein [Candidatus Angelobacter sp.]|jgi:membrane protein|nr:YihY/virulence factor BrkB family protein [Candidatus Angelobacter sp.]